MPTVVRTQFHEGSPEPDDLTRSITISPAILPGGKSSLWINFSAHVEFPGVVNITFGGCDMDKGDFSDTIDIPFSLFKTIHQMLDNMPTASTKD